MVKLPAPGYYRFPDLIERVYNYQTNRNRLIAPIRLLELEEYSELAARYNMQNNVEQSSPETIDRYRQIAMDQVRQLFNMEYKMCCHVCGAAHYQDEITAPER